MATMAEKSKLKKEEDTDLLTDGEYGHSNAANSILSFRYLNTKFREKERSRLQRQMEARRELEKRQDEKFLKALIDDVWLTDPVR